MVWSFGLIFYVCELGERLINRFEVINDALGQCDWYLFTIEMQRMYIIVAVIAQHPTLIEGFGNFSSSRKTFKKVNEWNIPFEKLNWQQFTVTYILLL